MLIRNKCGPPNYVKRRNNGNNKMPALTYFATWSIVLCCCLSVLGQATASMSFPITTLINAKWKQTPLYLEIAEYLADENSGLFWNYVQDIIKLEPSLAEYDMESKQYITAMNVVQQHLTKMQLPVLKLLVSMHSLTPRIQTHFQLASELLARGDCRTDNFAQVGLEMACNVGELKQKLHSNADGDSSLDAHVDTYSFDHFYTSTVADNKTRTVVLYGDMGSREFAKFHRLLVQEAQAGRVRYLVRHYLPQEQLKQQRAVRLSGYGVELHLKSTEYKSQDDAPKGHDDKGGQDMASDDEDVDMSVRGFDFKILRERYPSLTNSLDQFRRSLLQGDDEIATLKAWQFQDLGLQAAASIADIEGEETLQILQLTANNFPMQASVLVGRKVSDELRAEIKHNTEVFGRSLNIVPPDGALFINGLFFDADTLDLNALVETLRIEMRVLESLYANNVRGNVASALLALDLTGVGQRDFAIDLRDTAINWINDIENDAQYRRWPASVMDLLRPTFPGMLRNVRKNVFNLALVVDPLHPDGRNLLKLAESFVIHQAPLRLGLVFDGRRATSDKAKQDFNALICAFNYITQKKDARAALSFLTDVYAAVKSDENVREKHIRAQMKRSNSLSSAQIDDILGEDSDYDYGKQLAVEFIERLGYEKSPQALLNGVPMQTSLLKSDSDFEEAIFSEIIQQTSNLQKAVYRGELTDTDTVIDYLMNQPYVMPRLNQRILGGDEELPQRFLDLSGTPHKDLSNVRLLEQLSNRDMTATLLHNLKYFGGKHSEERIGDTKLHFLTFWVFADLNTAAGRQLLKHALLYVKTGSSVRLAFLPNAEGGKLANRYNLNRVAWAAMQSLPAVEATDLVLKLLENHDKEQNKDVKVPKAVEDYLSETELHMKMLRVYAQRVLGLKSGECLVIGNGKIIGPLRKNEKFGIEDFALIERLNSFQYGDKIRKVLTQVDSKSSLEEDDIRDLCSDTLLKLVASLVPRESKTRFKIPDDTQDAHSVVKLPAKHTDLPYFNIAAVVDPASRSAQKLAPILILLRNIVNCRMQIYLTPVEQHSDMPVKNFYRYVVEPEVHFLAHGKLAEGPIAKFIGVPANPLLTQNIQVPDNWLVEAVRSVYDLDNIKLSEIGGPVHSEFELEYLLLEGHCFDATTGAPPRGLQMTLGTKDQPTLVDTIVMANLGYFQLKANPGAWELRLRDGKSADIYDITHVEGPNTQQQANNTIKVIMSSLRSNVIKLRVTKKAGQQNADLLGDEDEKSTGSGIWNSIASSFGGGDANNAGSTGTGSATEIDDAETINIFSVASGHLYERLLRIMMISLLKHTKSPVKFWFLKNYLSPQFTDFLPHMAREYNFKYELVQYKWPRWLHQQTEKQRTIWGYKILFLDVLFPLNVRKIIFVDADAIVRADLKELNEMDLGSAPYAYTPFCDSRTDMEGFRFWKQGYWRSHLMGRRYHISALYVVDLKRFRKIAAGDRLRGQYQALSQDPNSLANLDQDLPNNMIHQVAIKSLPDNWLWCQTWCSDSAFKTAKVIDLCNNPLTKEAKLSAAQRIVPEWKDYDAEIKRLMARVEDHENADHAHDQQQLHEHSSATIKQKDENDVDDEGESHTNLHIEL